MAEKTRSFVVTAGIFVRWKVFADIEASAMQYGLQISKQKAGDTARFTVSGPEEKVDRFCAAADRVLNAP